MEEFGWFAKGSSGRVVSRNFLVEPTWLQNSFSILLPLIHFTIIFMCVLLFNPLIPASCRIHSKFHHPYVSERDIFLMQDNTLFRPQLVSGVKEDSKHQSSHANETSFELWSLNSDSRTITSVRKNYHMCIDYITASASCIRF